MLAPPMIHTSSYFADSKCANRSSTEANQCSLPLPLDSAIFALVDERMRLALPHNGRRGMLSHVVRPMTTALFPAPVVRLAKWAMSALQCGQGSWPLWPMPPLEHMAAISLNVNTIAVVGTQIKKNVYIYLYIYLYIYIHITCLHHHKTERQCFVLLLL